MSERKAQRCEDCEHYRLRRWSTCDLWFASTVSVLPACPEMCKQFKCRDARDERAKEVGP